jgi:uncharacterized membrane protein
MDFYVIALRWLHILGGVFWVGATFLLAGFLEPSIRATSPEGNKVMQHLIGKTKYVTMMSIAAIATVVAGALLYWRVSSGLNTDWLSSGTGISLTVGAIAALVSFVIGFVVMGRSSNRMGAISQAVQAQGSPPTPEQLGEIQELQGKLRTGGRVNAIFMAIAVSGMAIAQYVWF